MSPKEHDKTKKEKFNVAEQRKRRNPILWGLSVVVLLLIVITFIGGPLLGGFYSQERIVFGYYDGEPIEYTPGGYFAQQRNAIARQMDISVSDENYQWQNYQIWRQAFEQTVFHTVIVHRAKQSGLHISEDRIDFALTQYGPYIRNEEFSPEAYQATPNAERFSTRNLFKAELTQQQYLDDILNTHRSPYEKDFFKAMASPERKFHFIAIDLDQLPAEAVIEYGKEREELFQEINLSRITITSGKQDAEQILQQLQENPAIFEDLARNHSMDMFADRGGDMGWNTFFDLQDDFTRHQDTATLFDMPEGTISSLKESPYGWSIYRIDQTAAAPDFEDEEVLGRVRKHMAEFERGYMEDYLVRQAEEIIETAQNTNFESAAAEFGFSVKESNFFPINYDQVFFLKTPTVQNSNQNSLFNNITYFEPALRHLFSVEIGRITPPLLLDNGVIVAKALEERPAPDNETQILTMYHDFIVDQFKEEDLHNLILSSDKFEDNFFSVFTRLFMPQQPGA